MARSTTDGGQEEDTGGGLGPFEILIPISVAGWLLFGASCILCINGRGRAGRWVPEWYLDSEGRRWDKALVGMWWAAVMVLWPVILPVLLAKKVVVWARKTARKMRARRGEEGSDGSEGEKKVRKGKGRLTKARPRMEIV